MDSKTMSVSEVAKKAGVASDTIRYYGRLGLLPEAGRTSGGHRYFDGRTLERLRFIKGAQWFGLKLDEIGDLLKISDDGLCPCHQTRSLLERKITAIEAQRTRLDHVHRVLHRLLGNVGGMGFNQEVMNEGVAHQHASCACHQAFGSVGGNGSNGNGSNGPGSNGPGSNGHGSSALGSDGAGSNGHGLNGHGLNGHGLNGHGLNGNRTNGLSPSCLSSNGAAFGAPAEGNDVTSLLARRRIIDERLAKL